MTVRRKTTKQPTRSKLPSDTKLDEMIEEAIVDAYGESEQTVGLYTMLEENLATPFKTEMLGVEVTVERLDLTDDEQIVAVAPAERRSARFSICPAQPPPKARTGSWPIVAGQGGR